MLPKPTSEGRAAFSAPLPNNKPCFTYYKIFGDISQATPLICLHGGPGAGHDYLLSFAELWPQYGMPVIMYDQIGCGQSTHLPELRGNDSFWQPSLFIAELNSLIDHLGLCNDLGYHLLGHSFGGMIAPTFAVSQPRGLRRLVIASGTPSHDLMMQSFEEVKQQLPADLQDAIDQALQTNEFDSAAYMKAMGYFMRSYMCRTDNPPPEMLASHKNIMDDDTVSCSVIGPSPWSGTGSLRGWDIISQLSQIAVPTLVYNAEFDTSARELTQWPFSEQIPNVRKIAFANAGHSVHLESP